MSVVARSLTVFIDRALEPIRPWLEDDQVVEICANGPGEVWVERFGQSAMERHEVPALSEHAIRHFDRHMMKQTLSQAVVRLDASVVVVYVVVVVVHRERERKKEYYAGNEMSCKSLSAVALEV